MATAVKTVYTYNLNGTQRDFNIPFEYLARKFVRVTLIGKDRKVLTLNTDYRFSTKTTITTAQAWGAAQGYDSIEIRRYTSATERLIDFTDGSILRAYDLNISQLQTIHVAEEARDLTADTIGVNNDGHLDARGRRIINVAYAVDNGDAVPLGQLKTMNQNSWDARNQAEQFKNQAKGFRDEAEVSRNAAEAAKARAGASELKAKDWAEKEDAPVEGEQWSAKHYSKLTANDRAATFQSKEAAERAQLAAEAAQRHAANSQAASATSAKDSKKEADRAAASAASAKQHEDTVVANIQSYGALPVGTVVLSALGKAIPGYLPLDGSTFNKDTYPALFAYLGTTTLPDWRNRYVKMAESLDKVGTKGAWGLRAQAGTTSLSGSHIHSVTVAAGGQHAHTASTGAAGNHSHGIDVGVGGEAGNVYRINQARHAVSTATDRIKAAGNHTHTVTVAAAGNHTHTASAATSGSHTHDVSIPAQGSGQNDMDHVKVYYWIKAYGTTDDEQMAQVAGALNDIHVAVNTANTAKATADALSGRIATLETHDKYEWYDHTNPKVLEYFDWGKSTQAVGELKVKITDKEIWIQGIVRNPPNVSPDSFIGTLKKPLPGYTKMDYPFVGVTCSNGRGGMYTARNVVSTFPTTLSTSPTNGAVWIMLFVCIPGIK